MTLAYGAHPGSGLVGWNGASTSGGGCFSCAGNLNDGFYAGVNVVLSLGESARGDAGSLSFRLPEPDGGIIDALQFSAALDTTDGGLAHALVYAADGSVRQVVASQTFVDLVVVDAYTIEVFFYHLAAKGSWNSTTGSYNIVNGSSNLQTKWVITNPDAASATNRIQVQEQPPSAATRTWTYTFDTGTSIWTLTFPDSLSKQRASSLANGTATSRTNRIQVLTTADAVVWEWTGIYTNYGWGQVILSSTMGTGGAARVTSYDYYPDAGTAGFSPTLQRPSLKSIQRPDGTWEYITAYDSNGRPLTILSGLGTQGLTSNASLCYSVENDYTALTAYGDNGTVNPASPRRVTEKFKGTAIRRAYYAYTAGETRMIRCVSPSGAAGDTGNLVTLTTHYTSAPWTRYIKSVEHPDGSMEFYSYADSGGERTINYDRGEPNGTKTALLNGTRTTTVTGSVGQMVSVTVKDVAGSVIGLTTSSRTYSNYDSYSRPQRVTFLNGTIEDAVYACCGLDTSTDSDGKVTEHFYDSLKRRVATRILGITTTNILDAAGQIIQMLRVGSDGTTVLLGGYSYYTSGKLQTETNAFGGVISHAHSINGSGQTVHTTTQPDSGTRVETHFRDGNLADVSGTATAPMTYEYGVESTSYNGSSPTLRYRKESMVGDGGSTTEWIKTYEDALGRTVKTLYSDSAAAYSYYNTKGQLTKSVDPDGVTTLYQYNGQGEVEYTAVDVDQDGTIDFSGDDRINYAVRDVTTISSVNVERTRTYEHGASGSSTQTQTGESRQATTSLQNWNLAYGLTTHRQVTLNPGTGARTETTTHPDNSTTVSVYSYGRLQSVTRKDSTAAQIGQTTYGYDAHGRVAQVTDARNGATTYTYNAADAVASVTTSSPGTGEAAQTTTSHYDTSGRVWKTGLPDGTSTTNEFFLTGQLQKTYGSRSYPVEYTYDAQGRMKTMKTWRDFTGNTGTAITTWVYSSTRGWLTAKDYPNAGTGAAGTTGTDYTYTAGGRLKTRTWARNHSGGNRIVTTYKYGFDDTPGGNQHGDLTEVSYNDSVTPTTTYGYDRRGRRNSTVYNGTTTALTLHDSGLLLNEAYTGGTLGGLSRTNTYDAYLRRTQQQAQKNGTGIYTPSYAYDNASRLKTVSHTTSANYVYEPNSSLVQSVTFKESSTTKLTTTRTYDRLNRLRSIVNTPATGSVLPLAYAYQYNAANQRVRTTLADGSYWRYDYDELGQVIGGKRYWNDDLPVPGQQHEYAFDDIGNRTATQAGGNATGGDLRSATYTPNYLNQYASRTVPNAVDILGLASAGASVTVNSSAADYRQGEYFHEKLGVSNGSAVWQSVSVSTGGSPTTGNVFVPPATESYTYDLDGNLTQDGRWDYAWDGENRLIQMKTRSGVAGPVRRLEFEYDAQGRRIRKRVYDALSGGTLLLTRHYLYDGWNLLVELDSGNNWQRQYLWGLDLSGSGQGAGGVGGLLMVRDISSGNPVYHAAQDGGGNVVGLLQLSSGTWHANYEYGPFGETIRLSGTYAKTNPFRFSTKFQDDESDLLYYGYRYYNPGTGRWLSKDPIGEQGGINVYGFIKNNSPNRYDLLGLLEEFDPQCDGPIQGPGANNFAFAGSASFGPIKAGWHVRSVMEWHECQKCCSNGNTVTEEWVTVGGRITLSASANPWGGEIRGPDDSVVSWWIGVSFGASVAGELNGTISSDKCAGKKLTGSACGSVRFSPSISVGGAYRVVLGEPSMGWGFELEGGISGILQSGVALTRCYTCKSGACGWEPTKLCFDASLEIHIAAILVNGSYTVWKGQRCYKL